MDSDFAVVRWTDVQHHNVIDDDDDDDGSGGGGGGGVGATQRVRPSSETTTTCGLRPALDRRRGRGLAQQAGVPLRSSVALSTTLSPLWLWLVLSVSLVVFVHDAAGAVTVDRAEAVLGDDGHFTHTWAVHIPGGEHVANQIAADYGFENMGKIVDDHYHFHHHHVQRRSLRPADEHHERLTGDQRVHWARQQRAKSRQKRDYVRQRSSRTSMAAEARMPLNDPKWSQMWYLNRGNGLDMNVIPAWREGITGKGVVVTILDDGLESDHPDLQQNYDPKASYDVNSHDDDPMPHYDMTDSNRHGTRCAGEVAATANNSLCAVGIAYGSSVGGVRMLDGDVTDAVEARSLSLNPQHIDIYSASWGPDDDGKTVDGPGEMATRAFIEGVTKGRSGKGSIFVWASGNGGREHDNCNCDGYTNSIWTLSISSATEEGHVPWYSEKCSSTLATTYSSGGSGEKQIVTTDLHHTCTASHTGTSASAPLAAGIVALVLEANGNLTWRDLQHIVVRTAKPGNLKDSTWTKNGIGRRVSHSFGYGLMDASAMVQLARKWKTVPEQQRCEINAPHLDTSIPPKSHKTLLLAVQHCKGVNFLEHVQAKITLTTQRRGDIEIYLLSPAGTRVTLLTSRTHDVSRSGFNQWPFMSVHTWGEAPHGSWQLEIRNEGRFMAQITQWEMIFHGTEAPAQPNDPPPSKPRNAGSDKLAAAASSLAASSSYSSEIEHNSLEFEASDSDQWRDENQIGESHVDVQRTTSNDQTGSACRSFLPNQLCIECVQNTFLYEGRCYTACPERSYMVAELPAHTTPPPSPSSSQSSPPPPGMMRRRRSREHRQRPTTGTRTSSPSSPQPAPVNQKLCGACHFSCLKCRAPNDYDCTACAPDAQYTERSAIESYCLPSTAASSTVATPTPTPPAPTPPPQFPRLPNSNDPERNTVYNAPLTIVLAKCLLVLGALACVCELLRKFTNVFGCCLVGCRRPTAGGGGGAAGGVAGTSAKAFEAYAYGKVSTTADGGDDDDVDGGGAGGAARNTPAVDDENCSEDDSEEDDSDSEVEEEEEEEELNVGGVGLKGVKSATGAIAKQHRLQSMDRNGSEIGGDVVR